MPSFKYIIELSEQDRVELLNIVTKGTSSARKILRANTLLASDKRSDKYMTAAEISETYHTTPTTVQTVRTSYCENGLTATINKNKRETPPVPAKWKRTSLLSLAVTRPSGIQCGRSDFLPIKL